MLNVVTNESLIQLTNQDPKDVLNASVLIGTQAMLSKAAKTLRNKIRDMFNLYHFDYWKYQWATKLFLAKSPSIKEMVKVLEPMGKLDNDKEDIGKLEQRDRMRIKVLMEMVEKYYGKDMVQNKLVPEQEQINQERIQSKRNLFTCMVCGELCNTFTKFCDDCHRRHYSYYDYTFDEYYKQISKPVNSIHLHTKRRTYVRL